MQDSSTVLWKTIPPVYLALQIKAKQSFLSASSSSKYDWAFSLNHLKWLEDIMPEEL